MRHGLIWTLVAAGALALWAAASAVLVVVRPVLHGDAAGAEPVRVDVAPGASLGEVTQRLHALGVVRHPFVFRQYALLAGYERELRAGEYEFVAGESYRRILERLRLGDILRIKVTFPEGLTCREIAEVLERRLGIPRADFLGATEDPELRRRHNIESPTLEGYLFPDTYYFPTKHRAADVLEAMLQRFFTAWTPKHEERARGIGMTRGQVLALASIIEGEVLLDSERRRVSAVYHNRLRRDMLLQADPTVLYALGGERRRVLYRDLQTLSPYNTYINRGLPPGPICNPGLASIEAALSPLPETQELYFVAARDGSGRHVFSRTLEEHAAAKLRAQMLARSRASDSGRSEDLKPPAQPGSSRKPRPKDEPGS